MGNDATEYGVTIQLCNPVVGEWYWKITTVHHLTPQENNGQHHLFMDVLNANGNRFFGTQVKAWWGLGTKEWALCTIDKPLAETSGGNMPLYNVRQVTNAMVYGDLKSDVVVGCHTDHPDELPVTRWGHPGNSVGHHSFSVVWQLTQMAVTVEIPEEHPTEHELRIATWAKRWEDTIAYTDSIFTVFARQTGLGIPMTNIFTYGAVTVQGFALGIAWQNSDKSNDVQLLTW